MAKEIKKIKKTSRKRTAKKEVDIPVLIIKENGENKKPLISAEFFEAEKEVEGSSGNSFKITNDEENLPVYRNVGFDFGKEAETEAPAVRTEGRAETLGKKILALSEKKKRSIMWASVVLISSLVFFVWLAALKYNFSFSLPSAVPESPPVRTEEENFEQVESEWDNLQRQWSDFFNRLKVEAAADSDEQVVNKLKEKILIEELKNKFQTLQKE